jgi:hypothetical protein
MRTFRLRAPSPALAVSLVALIVALGGTSYAAFRLPMNSVGTKQLRNGAVTTKKLRTGAVTAAKLANGGVTTAKLANGAVTGSKLNFTGVTVPNSTNANHADSADSATNATNAGELGGLAPSSFVQGGGQVFGAHVLSNSSSYVPIVSIPGLGELQAQTSGGIGVSWLLTNGTNGTGRAVDEAVTTTNGTTTTVNDGTVAQGGSWSGEFGAPGTTFNGSRTWTVQFAWGSGPSTRLVTLTVSGFPSGSQYDAIVQGTAQ